MKRTYGMRNVCNVRMPNALGDVISGISIGISIGIAVADSIGYRAPAQRYWSNLHSSKYVMCSELSRHLHVKSFFLQLI